MKPLRFYMTAGFSSLYCGLESILYASIVRSIFETMPYDMYVFQYDHNASEIYVRLAGYSFLTNELNEETIVRRFEALEIETFWCKIDEMPDYYCATFLFPNEY